MTHVYLALFLTYLILAVFTFVFFNYKADNLTNSDYQRLAGVSVFWPVFLMIGLGYLICYVLQGFWFALIELLD